MSIPRRKEVLRLLRNNMLQPEDLIKMATSEMAIDPRNEKKPVRKVYDAVIDGAKASLGAVGAGLAGIQSLDNKSPIRTIQ